MDLGTFSISLAVADLAASEAFYTAFGFERIGGDPEQNWLILTNGSAKIGLFCGMFDKNTITFNPADARSVQERVKAAGVSLMMEAEDGEGPCHFLCLDPDGNPVLVDQH